MGTNEKKYGVNVNGGWIWTLPNNASYIPVLPMKVLDKHGNEQEVLATIDDFLESTPLNKRIKETL